MCWSGFISKSDGVLDFEDILPRAATRRKQSADFIFRFDETSARIKLTRSDVELCKG